MLGSLEEAQIAGLMETTVAYGSGVGNVSQGKTTMDLNN